MASLVIFGHVFEHEQVVGVFGFSSFYFVGLGWFVVYVSVVLLFVGNLRYIGHSSIKNWGSIPSQVTLYSFVVFFFFGDKIHMFNLMCITAMHIYRLQ